MNSTHKVEVFKIEAIEKHPEADKLEIVRPFGGYQCVVQKGKWNVGDFAAYVPPDTLVPLDRPEFSWLAGQRTPKVVDGREYHLVRVVKLRKYISQGIVLPLPDGVFILGEDLAPHFETKHYNPPVKANTSKSTTYGSAAETAPSLNPPHYDIDNIRRYSDIFLPGEMVVVTEKVHGANARYCAEDRGWFSWSRGRHTKTIRVGSFSYSWHGWNPLNGFVRRLPDTVRFMRVGSRNQWKRPSTEDAWWKALEATPGLATLCRNHPDWVVYGEIYGDVQDLDYGLPAGEIRFRAFDIYTYDEDGVGSWMNYERFAEICDSYVVPRVPFIEGCEFDLDRILEMAEENSVLAAERGKTQISEGVVVKPYKERTDPRFGRVILKAVSNRYLEK